VGEAKETKTFRDWQVMLVPPESSHPGFGNFVLVEKDHIQVPFFLTS